MADLSNPFSGYSVDDVDAAARFYGEVLGLETRQVNGMLWLHLHRRRGPALPEATRTGPRSSPC